MRFVIPKIPDTYDAKYFADLFRDMQRAASELREDFFYFEELNSALTKPRNGIVVYADGTNWNPGHGRGLYQYQNGSWVLLQGNKVRVFPITIQNLRKGVTAPTDSSLGTTPTVPTLYFSATNELVSGFFTIHENWDKTQDVELEFFWALASAQTNGDELSVTLDYLIPVHDSPGDGLLKTSTQLTDSHAVTTAEGLAVGDLHPTVFTLDANDANNGFSGVDHALGVAFELHLTNVTGVADIHLLGGHLNYTALY